MNKPAKMDDLFDLFDSKDISFEQLQHQLGDVNAEELNEQLQLHQAAKRAIRKYGIMQQVAGIHKNYALVNSPEASVKTNAPVINMAPRNAVKWIMRIAASVTLLFGLYVAQYFAFYSPDKMYNNTFREYYLNTERSAGVATENDMVNAFRKGEYKQVIGMYGKGAQHGNREMFLAGYAYLQENDYGAAEGLFNEIITNNLSQGSAYFQDEAEYYLAMARLKQGNTEGALELMKKIHASREHTFHESVTNWMIFRMKWY